MKETILNLFLLRFVLDEYGYLFHEHSPKEKIFEKRIALQMTSC